MPDLTKSVGRTADEWYFATEPRVLRMPTKGSTMKRYYRRVATIAAPALLAVAVGSAGISSAQTGDHYLVSVSGNDITVDTLVEHLACDVKLTGGGGFPQVKSTGVFGGTVPVVFPDLADGSYTVSGFCDGVTYDTANEYLAEKTVTVSTAAPAPAAPAQGAATVAADVDVYNAKNEPDGAGTVVGILRQGSQVQLGGSCAPESWCQVSGAAVPGGQGWVWGHLQF